jgi:general secretion pathway protein F
MPVYEAKGLDARGKTVTRVIDADNERGARLRLKREGVYATSVRIKTALGSVGTEEREANTEKRSFSLSSEVDFSKYLERVSRTDIANVTRQLATLVGAGIPLVDALGAAVEQSEKEKLKVVLSRIKVRVNEGSNLADALKDHPRLFSDLYVNMVRAGEQSGALELVLEQLAEYTEKQDELRAEVTGAMVYPVILAGVSGLILLFLMTFVVPRIAKIFDDVDAALPILTRFIISLSNLMSSGWFWTLLVVGGLGGAYFLRRHIKTPHGRKQADAYLLRVPVFGRVILLSSISRFASTLATLLAAGVPLLRSLDIVRNILGNVVLADAVGGARENVTEGQSLARPLKQSGSFPPLLISMIETGEKTGSLEPMLRRVSASYERDVHRTVNAMVRLIEPVMILVMGGIALTIALSIMMPLLNMQKIMN